MKTTIVIGAGAAGTFAAINGKRRYPEDNFVLLEATQKPLAKVLISGGGRCNTTHNCFDPQALVKNYPRGSKELLACMIRFGPEQTCEWFKQEGVSLVAEADGRMFPHTNKSSTIADCLLNGLRSAGVELRKGNSVLSVEKTATGYIVHLKNGELLEADNLMLATGSAPVGHKLAKSLGHTITPLAPSLFTFKIAEDFIEGLPGQSVTDAKVHLSFEKSISKKSFEYRGPVLVTHWGLSGPAILKLSAYAARELFDAKYQAKLSVNWLPQFNLEQCNSYLQEYRKKNLSSKCKIPPFDEFSKRFWDKFIPEFADSTWQELSKSDLRELSTRIVQHKLSVAGKGIFKEEFVTCGGVKRSEIDFKTMESKVHRGLFFAGEIIDIDGITGGFNFQNAWTGGWIASLNMS